MTISDTQQLILDQAARHADGLAMPPSHLRPAPRHTVARALISGGLVEVRGEATSDDALGWKVNGEMVLLRVTQAGLQAMGLDPGGVGHERPQHLLLTPATEADVSSVMATSTGDAPVASEAHKGPPCPPQRLKLRDAATALLACWDASTEREALASAVADLQAALEVQRTRARAQPDKVRTPRASTKQEAVLALLRRPEGATVAQVMEVTSWAPHTVRGFFAGLKRRGTPGRRGEARPPGRTHQRRRQVQL